MNRELGLILLRHDGFNWVSLDIAKWANKDHKNVMRDIREEIIELNSNHISTELIFELVENTNVNSIISNAHYKLSKKGMLQIASRYNAKIRHLLIEKVEELSNQIQKYKNVKQDKEHQKQAMTLLHDLLPTEEQTAKINYIKANSVTNKAVSNAFGFKKMVKKNDMSEDMKDLRKMVLEDYVKLFEITQDTSVIKTLLYNKYTPKLLNKRERSCSCENVTGDIDAGGSVKIKR
jgi:phage regulator Rha-like protein